MTLADLINAFRTDRDSPLVKPGKLRFVTKQSYLRLIDRIEMDHGHECLGEIKGRDFQRWHENWSEGGKVYMGHGMVGMLRTLFSFGAAMLDDAECLRLSTLLSKQRFAMGQPRVERLTSDQVNAIRAVAHREGFHSLALAQAFQFECMLRQRDVIGEWVPVSEPGITAVLWHGEKWLRGLTWEEIDAELILSHVTSKRLKLLEVPLKAAPMVMEEFERFKVLPDRGPIIVSEATDRPYADAAFRKLWREIATAAGVPKEVRNMDSRAGAISEATDAGADLEHIRHLSKHSQISMVQRYSRGAAEKAAGVMKTRADYRAANKGA